MVLLEKTAPWPRSLLMDRHRQLLFSEIKLFSTATIEYSCPSVCLPVCLFVCVHGNSKNNGLIHLKLEHIVVYVNSLEEFDIGHCPIKVKVTA